MSSDNDSATLREIVDGVGIVTLNRPEKFNCISSELIAGLDEALTVFEDDPGVRAMLVQARGKHFCTGADLLEVKSARESKRALEAYIGRFHQVLRRLETSRLPVVCAINGLALAGGLEIVLACDVAVAAADARIGDQHAQFGLVPGGGGTQRLARIVGLRRALDLMFSARWLEVEEARDWGLVNLVVEPEVLAEASMEYCRALARKNPEGLEFMKQVTRRGLDLSLGEGLRLEEQQVLDALRTANVAEGLAAFEGRREPFFK